MIYDPNLRALYADDGSFLKRIECPLSDIPEHMRQFISLPQDQYCFSCKKTVRCIDDKEESEVIKMVEENAQVCFFATDTAKNITILQYRRKPHSPDGLPVIPTVRSLEAMDTLQRAGYRLVIQETGVQNTFGNQKYQIFQHVITGKLEWSGDYRATRMATEEWRLVKDWFFAREDRPFPLAAYVLPHDIKPNTRVYLEDVIEDIPVIQWNQGNAMRLNSTEAIWDGKAMIINRNFEPLFMG